MWQIDRLAYELYGLTEEEIKIVGIWGHIWGQVFKIQFSFMAMFRTEAGQVMGP